MTSAHLVACPSCARHVRAGESVCPFCATVVPDATRGTEPRRPPTERLSRSALYAFGVGGSLAVAAACGGSTVTGTDGDSGTNDGRAQDAPFDGITMYSTHYGSTSFSAFDGGAEASVGDASGEASADVGVAVPYGLPAYGIAIDAAGPIDATTVPDADGSTMMGGPAYGGPAPSKP
jgi:hypothetical protein